MTKAYFAYYIPYKSHYYSNSKSNFSSNFNYSRPKLDLNAMLGRKVNNFSTNKFKFIKKKSNNLIKYKKYALKHSNSINLSIYKSIANKRESVRSIINSNLTINNRFKLKNTNNQIVNKKTTSSNSSTTSIRKIIAR
jgi:methionyl-tRNA synthetase